VISIVIKQVYFSFGLSKCLEHKKMSCPHLSIYAKQLPKDVLQRYESKLQLVDNIDPFQLKTTELTLDKSQFPRTEMVDIQMYFIDSLSPYSRKEIKAYKSLLAYKYFESGYVRDVRTKQFGVYTLVKGIVRHSFVEDPVSCWIICEPDGTVNCAHCICVAGLGEFCSHVAAVLFFIMIEKSNDVSSTCIPKRRNLFSFLKFLIMLHVLIKKTSCTSKHSTWNLPSKKHMTSGGRICDINYNPKKRTKVNENVNPALTRIKIVQLLSKIRENGGRPVLAQSMKEFWEEESDDNNVIDLLTIIDVSNDALELVDLVEVGKQIDISFTLEAAESVFNNTKEQAKSTNWQKFRYYAAKTT
jgi:hypothetical protein